MTALYFQQGTQNDPVGFIINLWEVLQGIFGWVFGIPIHVIILTA